MPRPTQPTDRLLEPTPTSFRLSSTPEHFELRKVSTNGGIRWHSRWINISSALGNEFHRARTHRSRAVAGLLRTHYPRLV